MTATDDEVRIRVKGVGAHSSTPEDGVNAVLIAANIITALQSIRSAQTSPFDVATFSICTIKGGEAINVIPGYAEMTGMLRCVDKNSKIIFREKILNICKHTAQALGGAAEVEFTEGYPSVFNDEKYVKLLRLSAVRVMGKSRIIDMEKPLLGSEDFSYYQEHIPGVMFMLGAKRKGENVGNLQVSDGRDGGKNCDGNGGDGRDGGGSNGSGDSGGSLHTPTLDICEDSLILGVKIFSSLALRLCS
jgi:amidohydrolase